MMKMKRLPMILAALVLAVTAAAQSSFTVGQFNMRYDSSKDKERGEGWDVRSQKIFDMVNFEGWDIIGAQELLHNQMLDLKNGLDGYDYIGVGRNDGKTKGEYAAIFYKTSRMKCLENGQFWLSETPEVPGSKGWDTSQCRICTWGKFEDKTTKWQFWVFNLHMDHKGIVARREGAKLVLSRIKEMCGDDPYILTGDFNVDQKNEIYSIIMDSGMLQDAFHAAKHRMAETGSMNYFKPDFNTDCRIDHVFLSPGFKVHDYGLLTYSFWTPVEVTEEMQAAIDAGQEGVVVHQQRMISDHYPVSVCVELPRLRAPQDWAQYARYEEKNKGVKKPKVVFIGDSITDGWYRMHPEFFDENNYVGRGISGQVTAQMLARFRSDVINLDPEKVVILAGTNDIAMNQGFVSLDHIYENIVSMAELAKCNGIKVLIGSILPADRYSWSWEVSSERTIESIREMNDRLKAYAKKNRMQYVDYFSAMVDENMALKKEYQRDAVHPNLAGYAVMEEVVQAVLNK